MNIELHRHARSGALAGASDGIRSAPRQALSLGATGVLFAGALAACGGSPAAAGGTTATVPLVVYSAQGYDSVMTKAFQKATGIPVRLDDDSTGPLLAKVAAEATTRNGDCSGSTATPRLRRSTSRASSSTIHRRSR